ncbi:Ada metal-binding domain-containing protein [Emticicia fontis]
MIRHKDLGDNAFARSKALFLKIQNGEIAFGGNKNLKIYGKLNCRAGKRMKVENRVFFKNETEAINAGYRPCAVCMRKEYLLWKGKHNAFKL